MDNLASNSQSSQGDTGTLSNYSRSQFDKAYADQYESILGHLVFERGYSIKRALESYAPIVKATHRETLCARDWCQKLGFGSLGIGVLVGAGMGIGFAVLPVLASAVSLKLWSDSREELPRREAEYHLLKTVPDLPQLLYSLSLRGCDLVKLIGAYDALITAIEPRIESGSDFSEGEVGEFLQNKISSSTGLEADSASQSKTEAIGQASSAVTTLEGTIAASPTYGVSKVLSPLERLLASPFQSRAWFGAQRTGKSYLAAVTSQQMHLNGTKVFHINLHSFGIEDLSYWTHAKSVTGDMGHLETHEVLNLITRAIGVVKEFTRTQNALLIFDEITLTGSKNNPYLDDLQPLLQMVASSCSELASTGKKRKQAIWTISPDFVAGELVQEVKAIKSLTVTFVAIPPGKTLDWEGQAIGFHAESFGNIQRNFPALSDAPRMDCDRMVFVDALWLDMGALPKLQTIEPVKVNTTLADLLAMDELKVNLVDDAIEVPVETLAVVEKPDGLDDFPLVLTIWEYLDGKDARSMKQISGAMKTGGKISDDILTEKLGQFETYKDAIKTVVSFGVSKGYLRQVSEDAYVAIKKH